MSTDEERKRKTFIDVQIKALDDIVAMNSLFTIAVFVGLSLASSNEHNLGGRKECDADPGTAQRLILYEVVSFAFFLLSSLAATTCKVVLNTRNLLDSEFGLFKHNRDILVSVAGIASFVGVVLLTLSMVNVVEIKIGKLSCGNVYAIQSVVYLCTIVLVALLIYGSHMIAALWYCLTLERWYLRASDQ
ncbi:hypothetical protein HS088_TW02G01032 [Tripterygium wilfordii]|uniref:PGG domain-containing protein n=1 Tax=Tripterygium wilfordii TaxID=458696 RepID=A0A7J7E024_TRIWF|nr:uncharacterized protein LOC120004763 [Tripterygium wilfordii]KAF5752012.1 hypothetical protein HS088_TW02G01032 [Tripterygium wilfordii]